MHGDDVASAGVEVSTQIVSKTTELIMEMIKVAIEKERSAKGFKPKSAVLSSGEVTYQKLKEGGEVTMLPSFAKEDYKAFLKKAKVMDIPVAAIQESGKENTISLFFNVKDKEAVNSIVQDIVREKLKQPDQTERMITIEKEQVEGFQMYCSEHDIPVNFLETQGGVKCIFGSAYEKQMEVAVENYKNIQSELSQIGMEVEKNVKGKFQIKLTDNEQGKSLTMNFCTKAKLERVLRERMGYSEVKAVEVANALTAKMSDSQMNLHYVIDVDIKGFFDNVNHAKLIKQMWTLGIRDKQLICIIKEMLKAPVAMQDGSVIYPDKGTPQGGILSPLLANIVLNELDWWIAGQWETIPTRKAKTKYKKDGTQDNGKKYTSLRKNSNLKEMYIVRYADDFKIFCRKRSDADKVFIAVKQWLSERLKLQVSEEKSKVVNLKRHYSDFLGFRLKAVPKRGKYVVGSHMSEKALKRETEKLIGQIKYIEYPKNAKEEALAVSLYNSMVWGIHNYYRYATNINIDCRKIQFRINSLMRNRLRDRVKKNGKIQSEYVRKNYGASEQVRFIGGIAVCPIGYIKTKNPMYKKAVICQYTEEGREEINKNLKFDDLTLKVLHMLATVQIPNRSVEYMDNRVSLYAAQCGKCAVTGKPLWIDEIHCHHKKPISLGGTDEYKNLIIVHADVHRLIHASTADAIKFYFEKVKPNSAMLKKINQLRELAGNSAI